MDWVRRAARERPDAPAVVGAARTISYAELDAAVDGAASIVHGSGMGAERVAMWGDRSIDAVAAFWGIQRAGGVPVLIDPQSPAAEQRRRASLAGARGLWAPPEGGVGRLIGRASFDPPNSGFPASDASAVLFTSGTEGAPKLVTISGGNVAAAVEGSYDRLGNGPDDPWLCVLPLHHVGGLSILWRQAEQAAPVVLLEDRFDEGPVAESLGAVAYASLVPTMLRRVLDAGPRPGATVLVGGAPSPLELIRRSLDAGVLALQTYGMTETTSQVCTVAPERIEEEMGTVGRPIAGAQVRVMAGGEPVEGVPGRIEVSGAIVADTETAGASGGWFTTGDVGIVDAAGRVTVLGRADAVIVTGGENVHPAAVERVLEAHPAVTGARVFGEPDEHWGTRVVASVSGDVDADEVRRWAAARLDPAQTPKEIRIVDGLRGKMGER